MTSAARSGAITVIKISGHEIDDPAALQGFAQAAATYTQRIIIVHGGGKEISALQTKLGITPQYVHGLRITDEESLALVEMVLCGVINKRLVRILLRAGIEAIGLSGVDRRLIEARKLILDDADLGFTGQPVSVRHEVLLDLLEDGIVPVIAPVCYGEGHNYNVNADLVAGAVAAAVRASKLIFLSNVPGVKDADGAVLSQLTASAAESLIASGVISGGMIPKVRTAVETLHMGVTQTVITDLAGLMRDTGTAFTI